MAMILRLLLLLILLAGCSAATNVPLTKDEIQALKKEAKNRYIEELSREIAVFDDVAYGLGLPLRSYLQKSPNVAGKKVLDLGTGSGVLALIALKNGARKVVATEINANAVVNAIHNTELLGFENKMDVRLVSLDDPAAYSVIAGYEKFDLIISNPPQLDEVPATVFEASYKDANLSFLRSILEGLGDHLTPQGKGVFALYEHGLKLANEVASEHGLEVNVHLETSNAFGKYYVVEITRRRGQQSWLERHSSF